jgi:hypothetical protein
MVRERAYRRATTNTENVAGKTAVERCLANLKLVELFWCLFLAFDSSEDALWVGGPDERFWDLRLSRDEVVDGDLQVNDGSEPALDATARRSRRPH